TFPPEINGVAMTFGVIARELGRRGHSVAVFRPWRPELAAERPVPEFTQVPMAGIPIPGYPLLRIGLPAGGRLRRLWAAARPDLVHVATEGPLGLSAVHAARSLGIPVTSSFHTNFHAYTRHYRISPLRGMAVRWLRYVHNRTQRTFVPTSELCSELAGMGFRDLAVLSRGVDTRQFRPDRRSYALRNEWKAAPTDPVVIHVGRMAAEKNYPMLFRIYGAMKRANPACRFVLAGEGPLKRALMRAHPDCVFAGFFSRDDIGRYYASADIYIHASLTETFGNVLTEAMASGLAAAGFDYAAARLFIRDGVNGLTSPCGDEQALTAAAVRIATDPSLRGRLRLAGRAAVEAQSWETVIARFEGDLAEVAGAAHAPASPAAALA
ncbi:MAG TPA: glycosyltransferase family 1 protein, partial [Opitutaceae bacterium]